MRILVLGAGAIGGYFGGRLADADADVTFLVRAQRRAELVDQGLVVESPRGDFKRSVATVAASDPGDGYDLVLLACKAYDLDSAIAAIEPAVGESTYVLPLLNGLNHLDRLDAVFGRSRVLGGLAKITATVTREGVIRHLSPLHQLLFGAREAGQAVICSRFAALVAQANFGGALSDDILQDMWEKFSFIATLAGVTCLMRAALCDILVQPGGEPLIRSMFDEAGAIATANGHSPRPDVHNFDVALLTDCRSSMVASMLRDLESGHRTEADHIIGDLIRRGRLTGQLAPLLALAYLHLQSATARHAREAVPS